MATKLKNVTTEPPNRSASAPPTGRISEPSSGPRKVSAAALTGVRELVGELHLQHLAEGEAEADERAEGADVEQRHDPGLASAG